jgi:enamine deaminase RidA (YjgF/YER057c/UK114 family)
VCLVYQATGEIFSGGIVAESHKAFRNLISILTEADYRLEDVVRAGAWLDDPRGFWTFDRIYTEDFGANPPARACVQSRMMVDCKIEIDCVAFKRK